MSDEPSEERRGDRRSGDGADPLGTGEDDERYAAGVDELEADDEDGATGANDAAGAGGEEADEDDHEPSLSGIFGARSEDAPPRPEIRPESVSPESALFVLLGVLLALFVFYRAATVLAA